MVIGLPRKTVGILSLQLNPLSAIHTLTNAIETSFNEIEKEQLYDFIKELNKSSEKTYLLLQNLLVQLFILMDHC